MRKTARQYLLLTYVCDLAKSMPGRDARDAIRPLFRKMASSDESREAFSDHLAKYIAHVKTRAEVKKKEVEEEGEGEEESEYVALKKGEQVGPGGLDPAEVFETLPKVLQEAFGERSIDALKQCLSQMSTEDATYHMKRCTDSGLWNPSGDDDGEAPGDPPPPPPPAAPAPPARHARMDAWTHACTHTSTLTRARTTRRSCATVAGLEDWSHFSPLPGRNCGRAFGSIRRGRRRLVQWSAATSRARAHTCVGWRPELDAESLRSPGRVHISYAGLIYMQQGCACSFSNSSIAIGVTLSLLGFI